MRVQFTTWSPQADTLLRVDQCLQVVEEYQAQDLTLTLRQLYYQLVSRDWIPNTERSYKNLGTIVSKARLGGLLDWDAIEDRGRQPKTPLEFKNLADLVETAVHWYRLPRWSDQIEYAELWVEKEALAGVLEPLAREFHVTLMVNKGYSSSSAMYESAQRIAAAVDEGKGHDRPATIFYLGDMDPSGEDMVRDIRDRLDLMSHGLVDLTVKKIALTMKQIRKYKPPPNPTKVTDSRADAYIEKYGHESWEVDALEPKTLQQIIRSSLNSVMDSTAMNVIKEREERDKVALRKEAQKILRGKV